MGSLIKGDTRFDSGPRAPDKVFQISDFRRSERMKIIGALIVVFMVSDAVAQMPTTIRKAPAATCQVIGEVERRPTFQCKDSRTGETQKVQCKTPPKQKLSDPDKVTLAELEEVCGVQTGSAPDAEEGRAGRG